MFKDFLPLWAILIFIFLIFTVGMIIANTSEYRNMQRNVRVEPDLCFPELISMGEEPPYLWYPCEDRKQKL